ncbi:MAG: hypothetical protein KJ600_03605, partial [Nanoarchaeota archaeon]|nr:hypothetical protein [Nanoarchaeota archaeon]
MKRGRFLILFILFSIVLFYTPKQDNPEITYLGCEGKPAPNATSDTSQGQNQDSTSSQDDSNINLVQDEKLINSGECGEDYEKKGEFIDNSGATFKHCVKSTDAFVQGDTYVTNSYLEVY